MLKFFFWLLLFANAALFAYRQGYLETLLPSDREPARMSRQLNADRIKLIPEPKPETAPSAAPPVAPAAAPAAPAGAAAAENPASAKASVPSPSIPDLVSKADGGNACIEIGNFAEDEAQRFSAQLAALSLGDKVSRRNAREVVSHIVYIPPQADKEAAEKKAGELRRLGVSDFFIIQDNSSMRWGISLGVFKQEEAARVQLERLNQKGVHSARLGERSATSSLLVFQLRGLNANAKAAVNKIKAAFPKQEMRACPAT